MRIRVVNIKRTLAFALTSCVGQSFRPNHAVYLECDPKSTKGSMFRRIETDVGPHSSRHIRMLSLKDSCSQA